MRMYNALFALRKIVKRLEFKHKCVTSFLLLVYSSRLTHRSTFV